MGATARHSGLVQEFPVCCGKGEHRPVFLDREPVLFEANSGVGRQSFADELVGPTAPREGGFGAPEDAVCDWKGFPTYSRVPVQ